MYKSLATLLLTATLASAPALADHSGAVVGGILGATAGSAIGHNADGRHGAIVGAAIGGVLGAAIGGSHDRHYGGSVSYNYGSPYYDGGYYAPRTTVVYHEPVVYPSRVVVYNSPSRGYYRGDHYRGRYGHGYGHRHHHHHHRYGR